MKKFLMSVATATLLTSGAHAQMQYLDQKQDDDFAKIEDYFNAMLHKHFKAPIYGDMNHPKMDLVEYDDKYVIKFNVAGYTKEQIKLSISSNNMLTLSGEQKTEKKEESKTLHRQEMHFGKFTRSIQLPHNADQEKVQTEFENGILSVIVAKKDTSKSGEKIIEIK